MIIMINYKKGSSSLLLILIIAFLIIAAGYFASVKRPNATNQQTISTSQAPIIECPVGQIYSGSKCIIPELGTTNPSMSGGKGSTSTYKTYSNVYFHISFDYPSS